MSLGFLIAKRFAYPTVVMIMSKLFFLVYFSNTSALERNK